MSALDRAKWRKMAEAPKDGTRIVVATRASEQGPADIDIVSWEQPARAADACWVSTDSRGDATVVYEDWEVAHWIPLPPSLPGIKTPDLISRLPEIPRAGEETAGSGI